MFAFFYPLMWLAVPLIGIPLWLHLQRRNDSWTVRFSAMQFLDDQPQARRRPLLPRNLPLLLLRLLILLLIIAAFAWPYVRSQDDVAIRESRVYVLDNTLSNQADGRFDSFRATVAAAVASADRETQVAVVQLTNEPQTIVHFGDDPILAAQRIRELSPGAGRGSYAAAFRAAESLLDRSLGERRQIVFLGDSQKNQWEEDSAVPAFLRDTQIELPPTPTDPLPNVSVRQPLVQRVSLGPRSAVRCSVRVSQFGETGQPQLRVLANGREVMQGVVEDIAADEERTLLVDLPDQGDRWLYGEFQITADRDSLSADDRAFFALPPIAVGRVALLSDSIYLRTALAQDVIAGRWATSVLDPADVGSEVAADALVLDSRFLAGGNVRQLVEKYLDAGRGVALFVSESGPAVSGLLRDFGVEVLSEAKQEPATFRYVFLEHPIFEPFRSSDGGDLADVLVERYRRIRADEATPLAFSASGEPVLLDRTVGRGRLLVFAFQMDRRDTNWPLHATFLPFLDRCLKHLQRPDEERVIEGLPGEACVWNLPAGIPSTQHLETANGGNSPNGPQVAVRRYGDTTNLLRVPVQNDQIRFPMPANPGNYQLLDSRGRDVLGVLSINAPPEESQLTFTSASETLEGWRRELEDGEGPRSTVPELSDLTRQEILRQNTWWWLLAAGVLALLVETLWVTRKPSPASP